MLNPLARRATASPMAPSPTIPKVLPLTSPPTKWFDWLPGKIPERSARSPSTILRATANRSAQLRSAVASVTKGGIVVTGMRRDVAAATSTPAGVIAIEAISLRSGLALIISASTRSCSRHTRYLNRFTPLTRRFYGNSQHFELRFGRYRLAATHQLGAAEKVPLESCPGSDEAQWIRRSAGN